MRLIMSKENPSTTCDLSRSTATTLKKHNTPSKNGVTGLLLTHPDNVNKQLDENFLTRTVENAMRCLDQDEAYKKADIKTDIAARQVVPNHASQLLRAAASQVSNDLRPASLEVREEVSTRICKNVFSRPLPTSASYITNSVTQSSTQLHHIPTAQNGSCCTTVSFTSKPTMSTGFASYNSFPTNTQQLTVPSAEPISSVNVDRASIINPDKQILVPFLWKRMCEDGKVKYYSPTEKKLDSLSEVKKYLLSDETCKCGLPCPFHVEKVFNFDSSLASKQWTLADIDLFTESTTLLCCHRKHIRSHALAVECKNSASAIKNSPAKRKVRPSGSKKAGSKGAQAANLSGKADSRSDMSSRTGDVSPHNKGLTSPLPPVDVVASQLRRPMDAVAQPFSPNHIPPGMSPRLMSPGHEPAAAGPYGIHAGPHAGPHPGQPIPGRMLPHHQPYPFGQMMPYPRYPPEQAAMIAGSSHQAYFPHHMPPAGYPPGVLPPFHNQPGYDYMPGHPSWAPAARYMPTPSSQFTAPIWQASGEASSGNSKRKRRASSKSSNGGNSDAGLASPPLKMAAVSKSSEIREPLPHVKELVSPSTTSASKISEEADVSKSGGENSSASVVSQSASTQDAKVTSAQSVSTSQSVADNEVKKASFPLPGPHTLIDRIPSRTQPNGVPTSAYMDPMYIPRPARPNFRPSNPMMYAGAAVPYPYHQSLAGYAPQPYHHFGIRPIGSHQLSESGGSAAAGIKSAPEETKSNDMADSNAKPDTKPVQKPAEKMSDAATSQAKQKLPDISTIARSKSSKEKMQVPTQAMNGYRPPGGMLGYQHMHVRGPPPPHMMQAPNGQMYYRYYEPHMQGNAPFYYQVPPPNQPVYQQPPLPGQFPPGFQYGGSGPSAISPKRKRRKAAAKTSIESHSAVLAGTSDGGLEETDHKHTNGDVTADSNPEIPTTATTQASRDSETVQAKA